jgi:hypothetical protein
MWVLVLFIGLSGSSTGSVAGYKTEQICSEAGREYIKRTVSKIGPEGRFICIPGPGQTEQTSAGWAGEIENDR